MMVVVVMVSSWVNGGRHASNVLHAPCREMYCGNPLKSCECTRRTREALGRNGTPDCHSGAEWYGPVRVSLSYSVMQCHTLSVKRDEGL